MSKRTTFTDILPLPDGINRQAVIDFLQDHQGMIDLNPLVIARCRIPPPPHAAADEQDCVWYSIRDRISYIPGTDLVNGEIEYTAAFHDLPNGLQTHSHAAMGVDLREKWTVAGSLPGEPPEPVELGLDLPKTGLYLRDDVDFRSNILMASFVKKTIQKAHGTVLKRVIEKAMGGSSGPAAAAATASASSVSSLPSATPSPAPSHSSHGNYQRSHTPQHPHHNQRHPQQHHYQPQSHHHHHQPTNSHDGSNGGIFVSSGANQGQPGQYLSEQQGRDKPYQVPRMPKPESHHHHHPSQPPAWSAPPSYSQGPMQSAAVEMDATPYYPTKQ